MLIDPHIHAVIMTVVGAAEVILAIYFFFRYIRNSRVVWYGIFISGIAGYVLTNAATYYSSSAPLIFHSAQWFSGVIITAAFFMFIQEFPFRSEARDSLSILHFVTPVVLFAIILFLGKDFITQLNPISIPAHQAYGATFWTFPAFYILYWVFSLKILIQKLAIADGVHHSQLKGLLFIGIIPPLVLSTVFDVLFPSLRVYGMGWIGPESSVIWMGFSMYIMYKK